MDRWEELLRQPADGIPPTAHSAVNRDKTVLITGAGGFIGSTLARSIAVANPKRILLLDHAEENLYDVHAALESGTAQKRCTAILGDISDSFLLEEIFETYHPDVIYHAAAFKHVRLMEENPFAVMRNNVLGTYVLTETAVKHKIPQLLMISTDKAVNPHSLMGLSKRMAEKILERFDCESTRMSAVRFGNVFGSGGSVVPRFLKQIAAGGPLTVTHPEASRYFLTPSETVELILACASLKQGGVFVPQLAEPIKILELAERLIASAANSGASKVEMVFIGLRPGEKLTEELVAEGEFTQPTAVPRMFRVLRHDAETRDGLSVALDGWVQKLSRIIRERDLAALVDTICNVVPEYRPSEIVTSGWKTSLT